MDLRAIMTGQRGLIAGVLLGVAIGASFVFPLPFVTVGLVGAVIAILALRSPFTGLLLTVFFLPFERLGAFEASFGTIRISQVLALLTMLAVLVARMRSAPRPFRARPFFLPFGAFVAALAAGLTMTPNIDRSLSIVGLTVFTIAFALVIPELVQTKEQLRAVIATLFVSAALVTAFGLFQFAGDLAGLPTTLTGLRAHYTKEVFGFPRVQSTALEPLYFANYLLLPLGLALALFVVRKGFSSWRLFLLLCGATVALGLTVSRGGYLAFVALAAIVGVLTFRRIFRLRVLLPILLGGFLVWAVVVQAIRAGDLSGLNLDTFTSHIQNVFYGPSYTERRETIDESVAAFRSSPFVGIGAAAFGPYVANYPRIEPKDGWKIVNNEPLELLAETGIVGSVAIALGALMLMLRAVACYRRASDPFVKAVLVGLFAAFIGVIVQYQTFSFLAIIHVWVLVGLLLAVESMILEPKSP